MKLHKFSIAVDAKLLEMARYAVSITPGITLASIARRGFEMELHRMIGKRGATYRTVPVVLSPGRPRKI